MPPTHTPSTITEEQRDQIFALLDQVDEILGPLVTLSSDERRYLPKMGNRYYAFVLKCVTMITNHPHLLSAFDNGDHIRTNFSAHNIFDAIETRIGVTNSKASNMRISSGSAVLSASRRFYTMLKIGAKHLPGSDTLIAELADSYPGPRKAKSPEAELIDSGLAESQAFTGSSIDPPDR